MRINRAIILAFIAPLLFGCKYRFTKTDLSAINIYSVGDTLIFGSDNGLFDSIEVIDKKIRFNGISEGHAGNPQTAFISYKTIPPGTPELVRFGGGQANVYSNEKYLLTASKRGKDVPANIRIRYCGFSAEIPTDQELIRDSTYGAYYEMEHFCINCLGVDSPDVIRLKWKPGVGIIWYQKMDGTSYTLLRKM